MSKTDEIKFTQLKSYIFNKINKEINSKDINTSNKSKKKTKNISLQKRPRIKNDSLLSLQQNYKEVDTTKIDYRHYKSYPIEEIIPFQQLDKDNKDLYWFVAYDKLIKSKKILKILNNDIKENEKPIYTEDKLKVKFLKIEDFEIFFVKGFSKPFVRPNKDSFILAKLYLLSLKEINTILNYLNKTKDKVNINKYMNSDDVNSDYPICEFLDIKNKTNDDDISYPYCFLYNIGKFMNISSL